MPTLPTIRLSARRWLLLGACTVAVLPAAPVAAQVPGSANKTPVDMAATDKLGDVTLGASYTADERASIDIASITTHQDRVASSLSATVTFAGPQPTGLDAQLRVAFGLVDPYGKCVIVDYGAAHLLGRLQTDHNEAIYTLATQTDAGGQATLSRGPNTVTLDTGSVPGVFDGRAWRCVRVSTEVYGGSVDSAFDEVTVFAAPEASTPSAVPPPSGGGTAAIIDTDGDGIHDGIDKCPTVPGAATTGCETTSAAKSIKLGTKRVVIDRLLVRSAGTCPVKVTAIVTLGGHRIGKQPMGTTAHGKFCQVVGVVKLKKRASKVKVVVKGAGVTAVSVNVKK